MYKRVSIILTMLFLSCSSSDFKKVESHSGIMIEKLSLDIHEIVRMVNKAAKSTGLRFPKTLDKTGNIEYVGQEDWASGYYAGTLWLMYKITGEGAWEKEAARYTNYLALEQYNPESEQLGVKMMCSFGNGYKLNKNSEYREVLIRSARTMISRFDEKSGSIFLSDTLSEKTQQSIGLDDLMNLEILFFAYKETGDPVFYNVAVQHAKTILKNSYSKNNITVRSHNENHSIYHNLSSTLYGFILVYEETNNPMFLKHAEKLAQEILVVGGSNINHAINSLPAARFESNLAYLADASISALALYKLSSFLNLNNDLYKSEADRIMSSFSEKQYLFGNNNHKKVQLSDKQKSSTKQSEVPVFYDMYYYLEALLELNNLNKTNMKRN